ncbi:MAG: L,D-transpeptidase [Chloroflexi bacterium]|nr:L,D-transpeptidase [Chloroflexota bacterium]
MRRYLLILIISFVALALGSGATPAVASSLQESSFTQTGGTTGRGYVCVPSLLRRNPELCPGYGPGTTALRLAAIRLPDPLPALPVLEMPVQEGEPVTSRTYAHVITLPLNVYHHPVEAAMGLPPVRTMLSGDWWLSVDELVDHEGQPWYRINEDEYVPAEALALARPSRFQGVYLTEQPQHPFAWINRWVQASAAPQGPPNEASAFDRYQIVTIFAEERRGSEIWYLIGTDQWVEQSYTSRVDVNARPIEVGPEEKWIEVDLFEQTIAAYEGDRMVYATLISSGRSGTATPPGLYRVWYKVREGKMSNPDVEDGNPTYYYIEDVAWTLYFHEGYSIHTAFWHDAFGFQRSHGCVNLAPSDAHWFYHWSEPYLPDEQKTAYIPAGAPSTWVWVHFSSPFEDEAPQQ